MPHRLFDLAKIGVFCDAISHTTEKRKDDPEVKVIQLTLRVQPFDSKLAGQVRQDVRQTLFKLNAPSEPQAHLARVNFALGVPRQDLEIFASSDTDRASLLIEHVKISGVYARTEKNVNGYAFVWKATFGPASKQELEFVENWRNGQRFITFQESEASLEFDAPDASDEDEDEHDDDQPDLPEGEFDTDADGLPKGHSAALVKLLARAGANVDVNAATAWTGEEFDSAAKWAREQIAANDEAEPGTSISVQWPEHVSAAHRNTEPARQRLHSHAGGKKKTAKASSRGRAAKKGTK
jgi:hypothetical protein